MAEVSAIQRPKSDALLEINFSFGQDSTPILLGEGALDRLESWIRGFAEDAVLIIDSQVWNEWASEIAQPTMASITRTRVLLEADERCKTMSIVHDLLERLVDAEATRNTAIVAIGGGFTGNMAGMAAGLLYRGVPLVHVPTTLLAMSDSVLSMKQAVNGHGAKNQFGLFYKPTAILVDPRFLSTLPVNQLSAGMVEVCKNALAFRADLLDTTFHLSHRLRHSSSWLKAISLGIEGKRPLLACDKYESSIGIALEYGHTVGHALELEPPGLCHGHAVALGMRVAARIAHRRGWLDRDTIELHDALIAAALAPLWLPHGLELEHVMKRVRVDNKRGRISLKQGQIAMVLLRGIGEPATTNDLPLVPVGTQEIEEALAWLLAGANRTHML